MFNFRWNSPPRLHSNIKEHDSLDAGRMRGPHMNNGTLTLLGVLSRAHARGPTLTLHSRSTPRSHRLRLTSRVLPSSFATTEGILFSVYFSAYVYA